MSKEVISENTIKKLIEESIVEVLSEATQEEGRFGDFARNVWGGVKNAAGNVKRGVGNFVKDPIGNIASAKGWYDQTKNRMKSRWNDAYNTARDRVRAQSVNDFYLNNLPAEERNAILQVRGKDEFGNDKFRIIRYAKACENNGGNPESISKIMTEKGFKGITPDYVTKLLQVGRGEQQNSSNPSGNPELHNIGGGYGMDSSIEEAVSKAIKNILH